MVRRLHFIVMFLGLISVLQCAASNIDLSGWDFIEPGSAEEAGLIRSLALVPASDVRLNSNDILELAETAGNSGTYPEANYIQLISRDRTAFDSDGYYHLVQQEAIKILTPKGVKQLSSINLHYGVPYDRTRILEAYVITPDKTILQVNPDDILDVADSDDANVNIYEPIWRNKTILFPQVQPGSILCYTFENCAVKPRSKGSLNWGHTFRSTEPIISPSICLKGPKSKPIHWYICNDPGSDVRFRKVEDDDSILYCWESYNLPMIQSEPGMVPLEELETKVLISTDTWEEYSSAEFVQIEPNLIPDQAIEKKVKELSAGISNPLEIVQQLFRYVTKKVRYMGVAYGDRPGVNPDPVSRTFENNAGVCKDKAGLLTAMLRLAGFEAYYTLNNPTCRIFPQVAVDQFNHAIVALKLPGKSQFKYLDVTTDLERNMIPSESGGTTVLRITKEGSLPDTVPISTADENMGWIDINTRINNQGELQSNMAYHGIGYRDTMLRGLYYWDTDRRTELLSYMLQQISSGAVLDEFSISPEPLDDLSQPVLVKLSYHMDNYTAQVGQFMLLNIPGSKFPFDWTFRSLIDAVSIPVRKYPLDLESTSGITIHETVELPTGYRVKTVPDPIQVSAPGLLYTQKHSLTETGIQLEQVLKITEMRIDPSNYSSFRDAVKSILKANRGFVILEEIR